MKHVSDEIHSEIRIEIVFKMSRDNFMEHHVHRMTEQVIFNEVRWITHIEIGHLDNVLTRL